MLYVHSHCIFNLDGWRVEAPLQTGEWNCECFWFWNYQGPVERPDTFETQKITPKLKAI